MSRPEKARPEQERSPPPKGAPLTGWRLTLHEIIFEADTPAGKNFDVALLIAIMISVAAVLLESVTEISVRWGFALRTVEWILTALFTVEYVLRLICVVRPARYAVSFFGIVDLLSIIPSYLSFFIAGSQSLLVIRVLRLLRVFRVLKLVHFVGEASVLGASIRASGRKIIVFLGTVVMAVIIVGSLMYLIEGEENGFTSIPLSIYWAVVTMTTVGYGDIAPQTIVGKVLAATVMVLGYGIIAVPTGIVTVELSNAQRRSISTQVCPHCVREGHATDAVFCKYCGERL